MWRVYPYQLHCENTMKIKYFTQCNHLIIRHGLLRTLDALNITVQGSIAVIHMTLFTTKTDVQPSTNHLD